MANTITIQFPVKGTRLFTCKVDIIGDGSGDESATAIITPSTDLPSPLGKIKLRAIQWDLVGFDAQLLWDASTDVHAFELPGSVSGGIRFSDTGSHLVNNAGSGVTGILRITTTGLGNGDKGTIFIEGQQAA